MENNKILLSLPKEAQISVTQEDINQAKFQQKSLSTYLNEREKDNEALKATGLDAFDAALLSKGIIVRGNEKLNISSSNMEVFFTTNENRILFPEFIVRTLKQSIFAQPITQYLIGETVTITGDTMKQPVLDLKGTGLGIKNRKALKKRRVAEAADIPVASLKLAETAISIYKYGIGTKTTYEALRRMTIDMFRKHVELIGQFAAYDEVEDIVDVIINGDGNNNPAPIFKRSTLNADGTAGVLDDTTLLKFLIKLYPINIDTIVVGENLFVQLASTLSDTALMNGITPYVPFEMPQGIFKGLTVIYDPDVPQSTAKKDQVIGLNRSMAIRKIIEQNSMIQESERFAHDQTQALYMTENAGFGKIYDEASAILEVD